MTRPDTFANAAPNTTYRGRGQAWSVERMALIPEMRPFLIEDAE